VLAVLVWALAQALALALAVLVWALAGEWECALVPEPVLVLGPLELGKDPLDNPPDQL